jgi:tRNA(Phe) wybutosine-synthesizing methylase Tyw3
VQYLLSSHKKIKPNETEDILKTIIKKIKLRKIKGDIWLRVDGAILHVASDDITNAKKLLNIARDIGFRRSGIISLGKNRVTMELISTERIEAIVSKNGKLVIGGDYFKVLVEEGNKKLEKTWEKIDKLQKALEDDNTELAGYYKKEIKRLEDQLAEKEEKLLPRSKRLKLSVINLNIRGIPQPVSNTANIYNVWMSRILSKFTF